MCPRRHTAAWMGIPKPHSTNWWQCLSSITSQFNPSYETETIWFFFAFTWCALCTHDARSTGKMFPNILVAIFFIKKRNWILSTREVASRNFNEYRNPEYESIESIRTVEIFNVVFQIKSWRIFNEYQICQCYIADVPEHWHRMVMNLTSIPYFFVSAQGFDTCEMLFNRSGAR